MRSLRSKEDDIQKISSRSKIGNGFGFVRFINVFDMERLVNNLYTVWIGKLKLHANVAQYQRDSGKNNCQSSANSYDNVVKKPTGVKETIDGTPTMVLDESCLNNEEFSLCLLGKVAEFASLTNLKVVLAKEGFGNIELKYMGGFWVMIVFQEEETMKAFHENKSAGSWFSQIVQAHKEFVIEKRVIWVEIKGVAYGGYHSNRLCIRTKINMAVVESFKMVYHGPGKSVGKCSDLEGESDGEAIPETRFEDEPLDKFDDINSIPHSKPQSEDPFGVYELLNKKKKVTNNEVLDRGEGIDTDVTRGSDVVRILQDIEKTKAMEVA
nr:hypothetical protein [Tanacetum cinerariifolium]